MNSAAPPQHTPAHRATLRVWDLPTRVVHWLLLILVTSLVITGHQGGEWMTWHARCGYGVLTLVLFRLVWGLVGGHHSRFSQFVPSWSVLRQAMARARRGPHQAWVGHNPMGALSVLALLLVLGLQATSGMVSDDEIAFSGPLSAHVSSAWVSAATWYHKEVGQRLLIGLVVLHVLAIVYHRVRHGEHLVRAMLRGDKTLSHEQATQSTASRDGWRERVLATGWLLACGLVVYALVQWGNGG